MDGNSSNQTNTSNLLKIGHAAKILGVSSKTLRRWEKSGKLIPTKTAGGTRYYTKEQLQPSLNKVPNTETTTTSENLVENTTKSPVLSKDLNEGYSFTPEYINQTITEPTTSRSINDLSESSSLLDNLKALTPLSNLTLTSKLALASLVLTLGLVTSAAWVISLATKYSAANGSINKLSFNKSSNDRLNSLKGQVLADSTSSATTATNLSSASLGKGLLNVNVPAKFNDSLFVSGNAAFSGSLAANSLTTNSLTSKSIIAESAITAPNIIYSITVGNGLSLTAGQSPTITNIATSFSKVTVGSTTLTSASLTDNLTFAASGGLTATLDTSSKKITFTADTPVVSRSGSVVSPTTASDALAVGGSSASAPFYVDSAGNIIANSLTVAGNLIISGSGSGSGSSQAGFLQRNSGILAPVTLTDSLAIGGTNSSAPFYVDGANGNTSTAGNITLTTNNSKIQTKDSSSTNLLNSVRYVYSNPVTVTNSSGTTLPSGYTYTLVITGANAATIYNNSQGSGNDVRISYTTGGVTTELNRTLDLFTSSAIYIRFATQAAINASSNDPNYTIYYGNSVVGAPSSTYSGSTILDNADTASGWTSSNPSLIPVFTDTTSYIQGTGSVNIGSNGSDVQTFSTASQGQLPITLAKTSSQIVSVGGTNYLYVIGGTNGNGNWSTVYKATIDSSGNVGAFSTASQAQLPQQLSGLTSNVVTIAGTNYLYVLGGYNIGGSQSTVYKATIDSSGNVGTFATTSQGQLPQRLGYQTSNIATIAGTNYLYVLGGDNGSSYQSTVYKATIDSSGNIGAFATTSQAQLPLTLYIPTSNIASIGGNNYLYVLGGYNLTWQSTVYKAQIGGAAGNGVTVTKTITSTDLSNKNQLHFWLKSPDSSIGSKIVMEFSNDGGTTWQGPFSPSISSANTWTEQSFNISSIANTSKNTVTKIRFRNTADITNFNFDLIRAESQYHATPSQVTSSNGSQTQFGNNLYFNTEGGGTLGVNYNSGAIGPFTIFDGTTNALVTTLRNGNFGIGTSAPSTKLQVVGATEQLRLSYDTNNYSSFTVNNSGNLTIAPSGGGTTLNGSLTTTGSLTATGPITTSSTLAVTGALTGTSAAFSSTLSGTSASFSSTLGVSGPTTLSSTLGVTGLITASGGLTLPANQNLTLSSGTGQYSQTFTGTTTDAMALTANSLTTGKAINLTSTSNAFSSGNLLNLSLAPSAATATSVSGNIASIAYSPTYSTAVTTPTLANNLLNLSRAITTNSSFASGLSVTGAVASFSNSATQTTGTITDSSSVLALTQNYAANSGNILDINAASGFGGNLLSAKVNSVSKFAVASGGTISTAGNLTFTTNGSKIQSTDSSSTNLLNSVRYAYSNPVTVTNSSGTTLPSGYTYTLVITGANAQTIYNNSQGSANDVRIGYSGTEIQRVVDVFTSSAIYIRFATQAAINASANDPNYTIYYGNPSASAPTTYSGSTVLDDANSATGWTSSNSTVIASTTDTTSFTQSTGSVKVESAGSDVQAFSTTSQGQLPLALESPTSNVVSIAGNNYLYVLGGYGQSTVYKATIDSSGNIGTFATTSQGQLPQILNNLTSNVVTIAGNNYLYVLGGSIYGTYQSTVYKATIDSSGNIGAFSTTSQGQLPQALYRQTSNVVTIAGTNYLYVIGGTNGSSRQSTVYKATIDSSGNVGTFATTSQGQLPQGLEYQTSNVVSIAGNNYLYVLGGYGQSTVYKATIDSSGNVGAFSTTSQAQLPQALYGLTSNVVTIGGTNYLYVLGGHNGGSRQSTVYKATIDSSGNIGAFATTSQAQLPQALYYLTSNVVTIGNNYLYVLGGIDNIGIRSTVYKAQIGGAAGNGVTVTKTITSTDLSNKNQLHFWLKSPDTSIGSKIVMEFSNDGGTTWQGPFSPSISSANTWTEQSFNISSIANASKNTVTKIRFRNTADITNFNFDLIRAESQYHATPSQVSSSLGSQTQFGNNLYFNTEGGGTLGVNYNSGAIGPFTIFDGTTNPLVTALRNGNFGIGTSSPSTKLQVVGATEQLRLSYDTNNYSSFTVNSSGNLTIAPTGGGTTINGSLTTTGSLTATGPITTSSTLAVTGALTGTFANFSNTLGVTGSATFSSTINSNTFTSTALTFAGASPTISASTTNTGLTVSQNGTGILTLGTSTGSVTVNGTTTFSSNVLGTNTTVVSSTLANTTGGTCGTQSSGTTLALLQSSTTVTSANILYNSTRGKHSRISSVSTCTDGGSLTYQVINLSDSITAQVATDAVTIYNPLTNLGNTSSGFVNNIYGINGQFVTATTTGGFDVAEQYSTTDSSIEAGDVVSINSLATDNSQIVKSSSAYEQKVLGVISNNPGLSLGADKDNVNDNGIYYKKVALVGKVPVKVTTENGQIKAGDYLTSSNTIPGAAMKATKIGTVIGKALENYSGQEVGKVLVFINVSFADPNNIFSRFTIDDTGSLWVKGINTEKIGLVGSLNNLPPLSASIPDGNNTQLTNTANLSSSLPTPIIPSLDLNKQFYSMSIRIATLEDKLDKLVTSNSNVSSSSAVLAEATSSASSSSAIADVLGINKVLEGTSGAKYVDKLIIDDLTASNFKTMNAIVSETFRSYGDSYLNNTTIGGNLNIDGTLLLTNNSINSLSLDNTTGNLGVLYLQNNPLATLIDIFNGKVKIDNTGKISAQSIVVSKQSAGSAKIVSGQTSVTITSSLLSVNSKIFITPKKPVSVGVTYQDPTSGEFKVEISSSLPYDLNFDWWIVESQ